MSTHITRAKSGLFLTVGVFLVGLVLRTDMFITRAHKNAAMLAISFWSLSESHCSEAAMNYLQKAERYVTAIDRNHSSWDHYLLDRISHFLQVCDVVRPDETLCRSPFTSNSLLYQEVEQPLLGSSEWSLKAYWVDKYAVELSEPVPIVLKWQVVDPNVVYSLPEHSSPRIRDFAGDTWCVWRDENFVWQVGEARNQVRNGGFEWYLLTHSELPAYYTTNSEGSEKISSFLSLDTTSGLGSIPTTVACLKGQEQFYAGLYVLIPITQDFHLLLQGATTRTEGEAYADIGGNWETRSQRQSVWAARHQSTNGHWNNYAQLAAVPTDAYQLTFRVANSGDADVACFDNVFVISLPDPRSFLK